MYNWNISIEQSRFLTSPGQFFGGARWGLETLVADDKAQRLERRFRSEESNIGTDVQRMVLPFIVSIS
ncbi:hypothetical protein Mapa_006557 [Marchantia paleacea]|nr:hypothetical protein Mapa_006557 [Marchantia paleacea]